ncbi:hypothetical protein BKA61DRAFT_486110 [Leptodontidium sp. MPI-SDFR-AT-0119]|nr:hypothetical protein BKA61DRAFT_486110 [Leptodontidium sp. MPI-SDFR-AT-0119]
MSPFSPETASIPPQKQILILGAGVTGLSTAISLLTSPSTSHFRITIIAAHLPGNFSPAYTSPWAGGDWHSHASLSDEDADVRKWDERTYEAWTELLSSSSSPSNSKSKSNPKDPPSAQENDMTFDPPLYLEYLLGRVRELGGRVVRVRLETEGGLEGVVKEMRRIVGEGESEDEEKEKGGKGGELFAVVNCAGLSARHFLPSDEAEKLFPIRGQTVLVKGEARDAYTYVSIPSVSADEMLYVIPRPGSGTTVLGGCKQTGSFEKGVDEELGERIMQRVMSDGLAEELRTGVGRSFEIVRHQVGFRPGRRGGPRVEVEKGGRIGGIWVVHNYGHGGGGFQASVGCAERVVELVGRLL